MGRTVYRVTGFFLALCVLLLGTGSTVLLYYDGQEAIDLFFTDRTYKDGQTRINRLMPTDTWYGELILRAWLLGFIYILPGITGIAASLFYNKCTMIVHFIFSIFLLFVGSFIHTAGAMSIVGYRFLVVYGLTNRYWLGDCNFIRDEILLPYEYVDERCMSSRRIIMMSIAALSVMFLAWIFIFSDIMYCALTYSNIKKTKPKGVQGAESDRAPLIQSEPQPWIETKTSETTDRRRSSDHKPPSPRASGSSERRSPRIAGINTPSPKKSGKRVQAPVAPTPDSGFEGLSSRPQQVNELLRDDNEAELNLQTVQDEAWNPESVSLSNHEDAIKMDVIELTANEVVDTKAGEGTVNPAYERL